MPQPSQQQREARFGLQKALVARENASLQGNKRWKNGVDNFVAANGFNFNKVQQLSTSRLQTLQQQSLRINKNP
jgi:hypothetical protein